MKISEKFEEAKLSLKKMKLKESEINSKLSLLQNYQYAMELELLGENIEEQMTHNENLKKDRKAAIFELELQKKAEERYLEHEKDSRTKIEKSGMKFEQKSMTLKEIEEEHLEIQSFLIRNDGNTILRA